MADLAVGISKAAVEALVSKVQSAIKEEAEKWLTVQRDLVFITGEFEMMQSFLDTASEEHVKNKIMRTWVRQVRDLSNDVEDSIDFILHIDTAKRSWWLRLLPSCGGKTGELLPVDEAVAMTTMLRARVVDVSQRNIRYNLISDDSGSKPVVQVHQKADATLDVVIDAAKMQRGRSDLVKMINGADKSLQVISVCGTGGDHGKISIIKNAYEDSEVSRNFTCRAWVKLTHSFNPLEIIKNFVAQFYTNASQEQGEKIIGIDVLKTMMEVTQEDVINEFMELVNEHRYLIIIEDISTMVQWHAIRSYRPDRKNGSRIIVSTQQLEIASLSTGQPYGMVELCQLSPDHSVCIFFKEGLQYDTNYSFTKDDSDSLSNVNDLGRDTEVNELFHQIQEHRLIFLCGMPGVGKSVIIRSICNKLKESDKFTKHAWINVRHPFNTTDFARRLLLKFHSKPLQAKDPIQECCSFLHEHKCLLVIDGLQSKEGWDWIKSNLTQHGHSGGCIIIITSDESVAKHCAVSSTDAAYNVKGLEPNAARELFKKVLEEKGCYPGVDMEEEAKDIILAKCGGLPRVIVTVARYLATKPRDVLEQEMRRLSDNFMQELSTNPEFDSLRGLLAWMHSYLDACPRHLKKCMLYVSIFPQDIIIRRRRLIRRWIAEGYSKGTDSSSMEKYAEKMFDDVAALSIMQPVLEASKVIGYRVNGFFREYIMSRPVEETILFPVEVSALEKQGHGCLTTEGIGQHLAIGSIGHLDYDRIVFQSLDFSRLRSLTVFNSTFWSYYVSERMRVLRVLDLENARDVVHIDVEVIRQLPSRLKFLSLRGQSRVTRLPDSVGELVQLQTLDIRDTSIVTLPPFITKLRKLQYIRAGTTITWTDDDISSSDDAEKGSTPSSSRSRTLASCLPKKFLTRGPVGCRSGGGGVVEPRGIWRLQALQTLGAVHVNTADGEAILDEIVNSLPQLKKLEISGISGKQGRWSLYFIDTKTHLESLTLQFAKSNHFVHWVNIHPPQSLRSLKMYGHVQQLPPSIKDLDSLVKLTLEMTTLFTTEVIEVLGSIPNLRTLRLRVNKDQDGELEFPAGHFRKLQVLEIASKSKLHVRFHEGAMEKLEQLKFHCLRGSKMQFSGLEHPVSLKQVWLLGSFDDALKEALQQQLVKHPKIPTLKLEVR